MKNKNIIVFDIGGTWFRSGIYTNEGKLIFVAKQPAKNYKNTKYRSIEDLQNQFVQYLQDEVNRLIRKFNDKKIEGISISMGAALNAHNGFIFNSGPLWGPDCLPFDLHKKLKGVFKGLRVLIINDVSAALLREVENKKNKSFSKIMIITVSTGIACRIFDLQQKAIPIDKVYGLQGEIGHITINFTFNNRRLNLLCDCGGKNHINAFCSGRGIEKVIKLVWRKNATVDDFFSSIKNGKKSALKVLDSITKPLADLLLVAFTLDPLVDKVILTGGVTNSLGDCYLQSVLSNLNKTGIYQISSRDNRFFEKRIKLGHEDDNSCLIGAALGFQYKL